MVRCPRKTNLVERPSKQATELAPSEFTAGVPGFLEKLVRFRPRVVCIVGKGIWDALARTMPPNVRAGSAESPGPSPATAPGRRKRTAKPTFQYDIQQYKVVHPEAAGVTVRETLFFVVPSTSGRVTSHQLPQKKALFALLKQHVDELRHGRLDTSSMTVVPLPGP